MWQTITPILAELELQPWWQALKALAASIVLAYLVRWLMTRVAPRIVAHTHTDYDDQVIEALRTPTFLTVLLFGINLTLILIELPNPYYSYCLSALKTAGILTWVIFFGRMAKLLLAALSRNTQRFTLVQPQTLPALGNLTTTVILGGAIYFLLLAWRIDVSAWVASAGIIGLAVSLAARDTLANLFSGLAILADAPFRVGDFIVLETGERGEVTQIGLRSSRLITRDEIEIIVPNSVLANTKIINEAGGPDPRHRVRVQVQVAYGSDMDQVREALLSAAAAEPQVCREPAARVRFRRFEDSGMAVELLAWVPEPVMRGRVLDALNTAVYKRFAEDGINIPFPQRVLHIANGSASGLPEEAV